MSRPLVSLVALVEALATLSATTPPRNVGGKNARFLGPVELQIERAGTTGGGTVYGQSLLGPNNSNRNDFVGDASAVTFQTIIPYVALSNYNWVVKADKYPKAGTASTTAGSATLTGSSTDFDGELYVGDEIEVNGERRLVIAIASDTSLTVDEAFVNSATGKTVSVCDAILIATEDFSLSNVGGNCLVTLVNTLATGAKLEVHYLGTPTTKFTFATATLQFKKIQIPGADVMWYVSGATTAPSSTNVYVKAIGE